MTYSLDTRDGYLRRLIAVGRRLGIKPRGIVISTIETTPQSAPTLPRGLTHSLEQARRG